MFMVLNWPCERFTTFYTYRCSEFRSGRALKIGRAAHVSSETFILGQFYKPCANRKIVAPAADLTPSYLRRTEMTGIPKLPILLTHLYVLFSRMVLIIRKTLVSHNCNQTVSFFIKTPCS